MSPRRGGTGTACLGAPARWSMVALAVALCAGFAVARGLEPSPTSYGTHTQLGLPPCQFAWVTGQRCPSCGMTTAIAWFVRGRFDRSLQANPAGTVLAASAAALVPWLVAGAALGRTPGFRSLEQPLFGVAAVTVAVSLVSWAARLLFG